MVFYETSTVGQTCQAVSGLPLSDWSDNENEQNLGETGTIDDVHRSVSATPDAEAQKEGKVIIEGLAKLKYDLQHDRQVTPLPDDGYPDIPLYNTELATLNNPTWFSAPWLYLECYLYRRIATLFTNTTHWRSHDIFSRQKLSTFKSSRPAVIELAARYKDLLARFDSSSSFSSSNGQNPADDDDQAESLLFTEMCEICLWGNATDLSLLTNLTYADIQKLQGSSARKTQEANILVNDLPSAFRALKASQAANPRSERRVDIILDNAGFELFVDLILAGYLLASGLATQIVLHPKSIPWFVSDVIPKDFGELLNALANPQGFYSSLASEGPTEAERDDDDPATKPLKEEEVADLKVLFEHWSGLHAEGKLVIRPNRFWTHSGSYWRMPAVAPDLYDDLRGSELVIFKGDLNYRKLVGDCAWEPTAAFREAIGPLGRKGEGLRVLALRTCKADAVVGLGEGVDERIRQMEGGGGDGGARKWAWSGKWAVVQFWDGKT